MSNNNQTVDYYIAPKASFDATADAIRVVTGESGDIEWKSNGFADALTERRFTLDGLINGTEGGNVTVSATVIPDSFFYKNNALTSISAPNVTRIGSYSFFQCYNLTTVNFPNLVSIYDNAGTYSTIHNTRGATFAYCHNLGNVYLPKLEEVGTEVFARVGNSQSTYNAIIVLPALTATGNYMFRQGKFKGVDLGENCTRINSDSFYQGTYDVVVLRSKTLVTAGNRDAVRGITNLYVPSALVSDYATATNWVTDAANRTVTAIEGSIYETAYVDGTPIPIGGAS